jgi:hypothetical protein
LTPLVVQLMQSPPLVPHAVSDVPCRQVVPSQHPAQPVQFSLVPQPSAKVPQVWFCAAHVVGVQPQTPRSLPGPPPQVWLTPLVVQSMQSLPSVPHAVSEIPGLQVVPSQQPLPSQMLPHVPLS